MMKRIISARTVGGAIRPIAAIPAAKAAAATKSLGWQAEEQESGTE
jgi:hypothetical protein